MPERARPSHLSSCYLFPFNSHHVPSKFRQRRATCREELYERLLRCAGQSSRGHFQRSMGPLGYTDERDCADDLQSVRFASYSTMAISSTDNGDVETTSLRLWRCWINVSTTRAKIGATSSKFVSAPVL